MEKIIKSHPELLRKIHQVPIVGVLYEILDIPHEVLIIK